MYIKRITKKKVEDQKSNKNSKEKYGVLREIVREKIEVEK